MKLLSEPTCFCRSLRLDASWGRRDASTWGFSSSPVSDWALGSSWSTCLDWAGASLPLLFIEVSSASRSFACCRSASLESPPGIWTPAGSCAGVDIGVIRTTVTMQAPITIHCLIRPPGQNLNDTRTSTLWLLMSALYVRLSSLTLKSGKKAKRYSPNRATGLAEQERDAARDLPPGTTSISRHPDD